MKKKADFLIIDGNHINSKNLKARSYKLIVKADEKVFSCAVASIIAKVTRDKIMEKYAKKYSKYGFEIHKGYPTKFHLKMLKKYGPCKIHRKSFFPINKLLKYNKGLKAEIISAKGRKSINKEQ
jgi:ribonuclease HII